MAAARLERRLAAILIADIAGYSRLIEANEALTLARLKALRLTLWDPLIAEHKGRTVKLMGDGMLVEFGSVVDAAVCAIAIQKRMADEAETVHAEEAIRLRIGLNLGDVVVEEGGDLYGEGVNVAARLEKLADPGGIVASGTVYDHLQGKIDHEIIDLGEQRLKNIERPVRTYKIVTGGSRIKAPPLPAKPSIAVLPFQNMSADAEQDYFADGVVEEIITALSRLRWLFVIARNSSFTYKGRAVDVKQVGRELGVRYVLEGSVRKAGPKLRITGQLIDATTGAHMWADRFDGEVAEVFDLQDQVAANVVGAIAPKLEQAEIERAKRKPTESLDAYDYYLRGLAAVRRETRDSVAEALRLFIRAIDLDPDFASAYGMAAWCYARRKTNGWTVDLETEKAEALHFAQAAAKFGRDDAAALTFGGFTIAYVVGDIDEGAAMIDRALAINPNFAVAWNYSGWLRAYRGAVDAAIEPQLRAMRLSPVDPLIFNMLGGIALTHLLAGRYDLAISFAEQALQNQPEYSSALQILAASSALAGKPDKARKAIERISHHHAGLRIANLSDRFPLRRREDLARFAQGLRAAGLPE